MGLERNEKIFKRKENVFSIKKKLSTEDILYEMWGYYFFLQNAC